MRVLPPPPVGTRWFAAFKMTEKNRVAILELMKQPSNNTCADCGAPSKNFKLRSSFYFARGPTLKIYYEFSFGSLRNFL